MAVYVKGHRRGKSIVKGYTKSGKIGYVKKERSPRQVIRDLRKLTRKPSESQRYFQLARKLSTSWRKNYRDKIERRYQFVLKGLKKHKITDYGF